MRRNRDDHLRQSIICSILLHIAVFALSVVFLFIPKRNSTTTFTDIEIASEGELQDVLSNQDNFPSVQEDIKENIQEEIEQEIMDLKNVEESDNRQTIEEEHQNEEQVKEESRDKEIADRQESLPTSKEDTPLVEEDKIKGDDQSKYDKALDAKAPVKDELVKDDVKEEPVPKLEEKNTKIQEKKNKHKKRNRKALMETIKSAEKRIVKERNRKKILEIADKASKKKRDNIAKVSTKNSDFDKMLDVSINDLKKAAGRGRKGSGRGSSGLGNGLTDEDKIMIGSQIYPYWAVPSGVRDAENIVIEIRVRLIGNGEVIASSVKILDEKRYVTDYIFRAAADSARRAILEASPLKIPKDKIEMFRDFIFRFNLKEALGGQ